MRATRLVPAALLTGIGFLLVMLVGSAVTHQPVGEFTRDTETLCAEAGAKLPRYAGSIGMLNDMVWFGVGSLALLVAALVPARRRWLLGFGAFAFFLAADDALMLHERVGPYHQVPQAVFYAVYVVAGVVLLAGVRGRLRDASTIPFVIGGLLLAGSVLVDELDLDIYLLEDGLKLLGAMTWLTVAPLSIPASLLQGLRPRLQPGDRARADATA